MASVLNPTWFPIGRILIIGPVALLLSVYVLHRSTTVTCADSTDRTLEITSQGNWLGLAIDSMDIEHRWLRGRWLEGWRTGMPLRNSISQGIRPLSKDETHCSAFAAAFADSLGVYLLCPPEHSHVLLANAQAAWLDSTNGRLAGWSELSDAIEAQFAANTGSLVVASYRNPDAKRAGHIAIVRPCSKSASATLLEGPQISQAGFENYRSATLAVGFARHPNAWSSSDERSVKFYKHLIADGVFNEIASDHYEPFPKSSQSIDRP